MLNTRQFSIFGKTSQQLITDLLLWEEFLSSHPVRSIIELGTGQGGMSLYLLLWAIQKNIRFNTFDNVRRNSNFQSRLEREINLRDHFHLLDVLAYPPEVMKFANPPVLIYCDDGNKPLEMQIYSRLLRPGDFIAVHDYGIEIHQDDLQGLPILEVETIYASLNGITKFYKIVEQK